MMDVLMAIFDFVPVGLFLAAAIIYQRMFYNKMSKGAFAVFACGTILIFVAGGYKALHKILYYGANADWRALAVQFFPMQTTGFLLAGAGMIAMLVHPQGSGKTYSFAPIFLLLPLLLAEGSVPEFNGTMIFVALMILGVAAMDGSYIFIAIKRKEWLIVGLLVLAFIGTLGMGYLSTKDSMSDWIKEFVNTVAQGALLASAILFKKHGLEAEDAIKGIGKHN